MANMQILVSIDDTDNLESRGTGEIASLIAGALQQNGWGTTSIVTRHQLLVHPDIPYTSHNSSMCFLAQLHGDHLEKVIAFARSFLDHECAEGSDPGLCVAVLERIGSIPELVAFGQRAKQEVLTMADAYDLAGRLGVHLSEHGGTGQGVIGALAGAGLRLGGNDGRMKGCLKFTGAVQRVAEILDHPGVDAVRCIAGGRVGLEDLVAIGEKPKTVQLGGLSVLLLAERSDAGGASWQTLPRKQLSGY
jgi:hypothetical protein